MKSVNVVLMALLVILIILVVYQGSVLLKERGHTGDSFAGSTPQYRKGPYNPYTVLNEELSAIRGHRSDGYKQVPFYRDPKKLDQYRRSGANLQPEDLAEAERQSWYSAISSAHTDSFNSEVSHDPASDTMQYHSVSPLGDYNAYVTDLIVDPRTRENHDRWTEEMKPWAGTAMMVDDLDVGNYVDFTGLRRPQAVVQYNPLQLTEVDTGDLAKNKKFNFQG